MALPQLRARFAAEFAEFHHIPQAAKERRVEVLLAVGGKDRNSGKILN